MIPHHQGRLYPETNTNNTAQQTQDSSQAIQPQNQNLKTPPSTHPPPSSLQTLCSSSLPIHRSPVNALAPCLFVVVLIVIGIVDPVTLVALLATAAAAGRQVPGSLLPCPWLWI